MPHYHLVAIVIIQCGCSLQLFQPVLLKFQLYGVYYFMVTWTLVAWLLRNVIYSKLSFDVQTYLLGTLFLFLSATSFLQLPAWLHFHINITNCLPQCKVWTLIFWGSKTSRIWFQVVAKKKWTLTIWESQTPNVQFQILKIDSLNISQIKKVEHPISKFKLLTKKKTLNI